jgi:hypothetical protein
MTTNAVSGRGSADAPIPWTGVTTSHTAAPAIMHLNLGVTVLSATRAVAR